jgi:Fe2+ or Zn2+ uptake regulation protein
MKPRPSAKSKTVHASRSSAGTDHRSADDTIHGAGLRMTEQRRAVYDALLGERDHPTAVDVFTRVRERMPAISLATVYNCLDTLTACHLVKTVQLDRGPARYCPNLKEHAHFHCESCGTVLDLPLRTRRHPHDVWELPQDLSITGHEVAFRGICPKCARSKKNH